MISGRSRGIAWAHRYRHLGNSQSACDAIDDLLLWPVLIVIVLCGELEIVRFDLWSRILRVFSTCIDLWSRQFSWYTQSRTVLRDFRYYGSSLRSLNQKSRQVLPRQERTGTYPDQIDFAHCLIADHVDTHIFFWSKSLSSKRRREMKEFVWWQFG